jgi:hypothetical protein
MGCQWLKSEEGTPIALLIPHDFTASGYNFLTPCETPFQVGVNSYASGAQVKAHRHNAIERTIHETMEYVLVRKGAMSLELFDAADRPFKTIHMSAGDSILLVSGGHGMTFSTDCELLEVKQGPFFSRVMDKTLLFDPPAAEDAR